MYWYFDQIDTLSVRGKDAKVMENYHHLSQAQSGVLESLKKLTKLWSTTLTTAYQG